jgi:hypothetical protein
MQHARVRGRYQMWCGKDQVALVWTPGVCCRVGRLADECPASSEGAEYELEESMAAADAADVGMLASLCAERVGSRPLTGD